jgi:hypothetical protein
MMQIPGFLPIPSPWPDIDDHIRNQYKQWLHAFENYMTKQCNEFSRQTVCSINIDRSRSMISCSSQGLLFSPIESLHHHSNA